MFNFYCTKHLFVWGFLVFGQILSLTITSDRRFTTDANQTVQFDCKSNSEIVIKEVSFRINDIEVYNSQSTLFSPNITVQSLTSIVLKKGAIQPPSLGIKALCVVNGHLDSDPIRIPHVSSIPLMTLNSAEAGNDFPKVKAPPFNITCSVNVQPRETAFSVYNVTFFRENRPFAAYTASKFF